MWSPTCGEPLRVVELVVVTVTSLPDRSFNTYVLPVTFVISPSSSFALSAPARLVNVDRLRLLSAPAIGEKVELEEGFVVSSANPSPGTGKVKARTIKLRNANFRAFRSAAMMPPLAAQFVTLYST